MPTHPRAVIQQASKGLSRAVNNLAIQPLVAIFTANNSVVDEAAAETAVVEVIGE